MRKCATRFENGAWVVRKRGAVRHITDPLVFPVIFSLLVFRLRVLDMSCLCEVCASLFDPCRQKKFSQPWRCQPLSDTASLMTVTISILVLRWPYRRREISILTPLPSYQTSPISLLSNSHTKIEKRAKKGQFEWPATSRDLPETHNTLCTQKREEITVLHSSWEETYNDSSILQTFFYTFMTCVPLFLYTLPNY